MLMFKCIRTEKYSADFDSNCFIFKMMLFFNIQTKRGLLKFLEASVEEVSFFHHSGILPISWIDIILSRKGGAEFIRENWLSKLKVKKEKENDMEIINCYIPEENRQRFLIGFQGLVARDYSLFVQKVDKNLLKNFENNGEILFAWLEFLNNEGGIALVKRHCRKNSGERAIKRVSLEDCGGKKNRRTPKRKRSTKTGKTADCQKSLPKELEEGIKLAKQIAVGIRDHIEEYDFSGELFVGILVCDFPDYSFRVKENQLLIKKNNGGRVFIVSLKEVL